MSMPSFGPTPTYAFFIYSRDETDELAVHWRGDEWGTEYHADMRGWYHDPLMEAGYLALLDHYGLPRGDPELSFEKVKGMPPEDLVAARRSIEKVRNSKPMKFREGVDFWELSQESPTTSTRRLR